MLILTALIAAAFAATADYQSLFVNFMHEHKKSYSHDEFQAKFEQFKKNVDFIEAHNANKANTHTVRMNEFGDLSAQEFAKIYNGVKYVHDANKKIDMPKDLIGVDVNALPQSVDWRAKGAVTPIKNQGQCGSCWSFSATGSIEGQHFIKKQQSPSGQKPLVGLSEQNLMDCSSSYGNDACDGGLMDQAFQYVIANKGIDMESDYPYTAEDGNYCLYKQSERGACIENYHDIPSGNENALWSAIATVGPISVAIDASHSSFQFYDSGIYYEPNCSSTQLDHGVLAVGYGETGTQKYYLVKNSWGTQWGWENGYIKMSAFRHNNCGIATSASYPEISKTQC